MSESCDVIAIFPIYSKFWAIRKPDSGRIVCRAYIFIDSNLLSYKTDLKYLNTSLTLLLKVLFLAKSADFLQKMLTPAKLRGPWY